MLTPVIALLLGLFALIPSLGALRLPTIHATSAIPAGSDQRKKGVHEEDFLLFGTVFTEQGFALPGAEIRCAPLRRAKGALDCSFGPSR